MRRIVLQSGRRFRRCSWSSSTSASGHPLPSSRVLATYASHSVSCQSVNEENTNAMPSRASVHWLAALGHLQTHRPQHAVQCTVSRGPTRRSRRRITAKRVQKLSVDNGFETFDACRCCGIDLHERKTPGDIWGITLVRHRRLHELSRVRSWSFNAPFFRQECLPAA